MKILGRIGRIFVPFYNIKRSLGVAQIKESYQNVSGAATDIFSRKKTSSIIETYEEALVRLNINPEAESTIRTNFFRSAMLYLIIAAALLIYGVYLIFTSYLIAVFIAFVLFMVALALAFKEHFWYTQMKYRRLGLSFKEWVQYTFSRNKK